MSSLKPASLYYYCFHLAIISPKRQAPQIRCIKPPSQPVEPAQIITGPEKSVHLDAL